MPTYRAHSLQRKDQYQVRNVSVIFKCLSASHEKLITWIKDKVDSHVKETVGNKVNIDALRIWSYPSGITPLTYFNVLFVIFITCALLFENFVRLL